VKPKTDVMATMTQSERLRATANLYLKLLGPNAKPMMEQLRPGFTSRQRQLGDAPDPAQNHWRGAWRIYELK
jgi:hypothetical protein